MECKFCKYSEAHNYRHQCLDLSAGKTCADCIHVKGCTVIFGAEPENTSCGWEPVHFREKDHLLREEKKRDGFCEADIDRAADLIRRLREQVGN